jgi:hypothetical protein
MAMKNPPDVGGLIRSIFSSANILELVYPRRISGTISSSCLCL